MHRNEEAYFRPPGKLTCLLPLFFKRDLIRLVLRNPGRVTILWRRRRWQRRRERRRLGRRSPKPLNAATHPRGFTRNSFRRRATNARSFELTQLFLQSIALSLQLRRSGRPCFQLLSLSFHHQLRFRPIAPERIGCRLHLSHYSTLLFHDPLHFPAIFEQRLHPNLARLEGKLVALRHLPPGLRFDARGGETIDLGQLGSSGFRD